MPNDKEHDKTFSRHRIDRHLVHCRAITGSQPRGDEPVRRCAPSARREDQSGKHPCRHRQARHRATDGSLLHAAARYVDLEPQRRTHGRQRLVGDRGRRRRRPIAAVSPHRRRAPTNGKSDSGLATSPSSSKETIGRRGAYAPFRRVETQPNGARLNRLASRRAGRASRGPRCNGNLVSAQASRRSTTFTIAKKKNGSTSLPFFCKLNCIYN